MERVETAKKRTGESNRVRLLVSTALLAALSCVATMAIKVPSPTGGYTNLGDAAVLLGAFLLGPWYGAAAGGIGSMMADVLSGYPLYAPATLVIKALVAMTAGLLGRCLAERRGGLVLAAAVGELPMIVGYWLYDALLMHSLIGGAAGLPANLVQAVLGIVIAWLLCSRCHLREKFREILLR